MKKTYNNIFHFTSDDFDKVAEAVKGWDLDLQKLDAVPFRGEVIQRFMPSCILLKAQFNCRLKQVGGTPKGFRTFAIPAVASLDMRWRNQNVTGNDLLLFPETNELHASSNHNFNVFTLSIKEELLHAAAERTNSIGLNEIIKSTEVFRCDRIRINRLLSSLHQCLASSLDNHSVPLTATCNHIFDQLVQLITSASDKTPHKLTNLRRKIVLLSENYILEHPDDPPSVEKLCDITGASDRTVEYAFNEYYGITPKAYINNLRLHAVRKQLRASSHKDIHVCDAANNWGFWHMGQFAADYRKLFGMNPSVTLGCDPQKCNAKCRYKNGCNVCKF